MHGTLSGEIQEKLKLRQHASQPQTMHYDLLEILIGNYY